MNDLVQQTRMTNYHQLKGTLHKKEMLLSYNNEIADVENRRVDTGRKGRMGLVERVALTYTL